MLHFFITSDHNSFGSQTFFAPEYRRNYLYLLQIKTIGHYMSEYAIYKLV